MDKCDRCGKEITEYVPLNAIPRGKTRSLPFTLYLPTAETFCTVREGRFCGDCVQSFFDWWEEGKLEKCKHADKCGVWKSCAKGSIIKDTCPFINEKKVDATKFEDVTCEYICEEGDDE